MQKAIITKADLLSIIDVLCRVSENRVVSMSEARRLANLLQSQIEAR